MQGQYPPRAPGIAAGQSARTTPATYFDYQGILRTAQPGELRPNYVYQNGVWVQDGYLREGEATNYLQTPTGNIGGSLGYPNSYVVAKDAAAPLSPLGVPNDSQLMIGSAYVLLNHPSTTANRIDVWWGGGGTDGSYVDLTTKSVVGTSGTWKLSCDIIGKGLRIWLQGGPPHATMWPPVFIPRNGSCVFACPQNEAMTADGKPTSWIPYGQTRGAD